jgi:hypothetical protein
MKSSAPGDSRGPGTFFTACNRTASKRDSVPKQVGRFERIWLLRTSRGKPIERSLFISQRIDVKQKANDLNRVGYIQNSKHTDIDVCIGTRRRDREYDSCHPDWSPFMANCRLVNDDQLIREVVMGEQPSIQEIDSLGRL